MSLLNILLVAAGSAFGGTLRYVVGFGMLKLLGDAFPWGTLLVNITGSLALGSVWSLVHEVWTFDPARLIGKEQWWLLLAVGVMGGYTTFSTFERDTYLLFTQGRAWSAVAYITSSVFIGLIAFRCGMLLAGGE